MIQTIPVILKNLVMVILRIQMNQTNPMIQATQILPVAAQPGEDLLAAAEDPMKTLSSLNLNLRQYHPDQNKNCRSCPNLLQ